MESNFKLDSHSKRPGYRENDQYGVSDVTEYLHCLFLLFILSNCVYPLRLSENNATPLKEGLQKNECGARDKMLLNGATFVLCAKARLGRGGADDDPVVRGSFYSWSSPQSETRTYSAKTCAATAVNLRHANL
jgi:hypothetical protein